MCRTETQEAVTTDVTPTIAPRPRPLDDESPVDHTDVDVRDHTLCNDSSSEDRVGAPDTTTVSLRWKDGADVSDFTFNGPETRKVPFGPTEGDTGTFEPQGRDGPIVVDTLGK